MKKLSNLIHEISNIKIFLDQIHNYPVDFTEDLIKAHQDKKLMPLIHLPVQSGSNNILKSMNRKHTMKDYFDIVKKLKNINSKIKFSSDFIIGYPGETEKDFGETLKLIKKMEYINIYSFIFSPRPGTPAATLPHINEEITKQRLKVFQKKAAEIKMKYRKNLFDKTSKVLFENKIKNSDEYFGRDEYLNSVIVKSDKNLKGKVLEVKILNGNQSTLFGMIKKNERGCRIACSQKLVNWTKI